MVYRLVASLAAMQRSRKSQVTAARIDVRWSDGVEGFKTTFTPADCTSICVSLSSVGSSASGRGSGGTGRGCGLGRGNGAMSPMPAPMEVHVHRQRQAAAEA
jgi:hypothetical protein